MAHLTPHSWYSLVSIIFWHVYLRAGLSPSSFWIFPGTTPVFLEMQRAQSRERKASGDRGPPRA